LLLQWALSRLCLCLLLLLLQGLLLLLSILLLTDLMCLWYAHLLMQRWRFG
jgi:hypothetical protein